MSKKELRVWKKVALSDVEYLANEMKDLLVPQAVIILTGPVGSGKTTLLSSFISSDFPLIGGSSFTILNEYGSILHGDFYRLKTKAEVYSLEIPMYLEGKSHIIIEWGHEYLRELINEIGLSAQYYEVEITDVLDSNQHYRNYTLSQMDPND